MIFRVRTDTSRVDLVIFGASGDLANRKILPAIRRLASRGDLPAGMRVIGVGRSAMARDEFRKRVADSKGRVDLAATAEWVRLDYSAPQSYRALADVISNSRCAIFYLATPPQTFIPIVSTLRKSGLSRKGDSNRRVVVEKPLGHDLDSAREINRELMVAFDEGEIFRIDHYLAKDTVQNVLAFRFSNSVFEPIWNRTLIDSIQLTVAEDGGIGDRAGYYDQIGAVRDVLQNHVLQLLAVATMEPPNTLDADDIRHAKVEALQAMQPIDPAEAVRGQYEGYLDVKGVSPTSRTETYAAARLVMDNWRWDGVPIYIRTGKALRRRVTEVIIRFRDAPHLRLDGRRQRSIPTLLVIRIQPHEAISLRIGAKLPGAGFEMVPAGMTLEYTKLAKTALPDAYEHVLSEVLAGGHGVFPSGDEIDRSWELVDPLMQAWESGGHPETYKKGSWGPGGAEELVATTGGGRWINSGDEPGTL